VSDSGNTPQPPWYSLLAAGLLLVNGIGLIWYEAAIEQADRPYLIFAALAMMGLVPRSVLEWLRDALGKGK